MRESADAFAAYVDDNSPSVLRCLSVALRDARVARDATEQAFGRAYSRWSRVRRAGQPAAWVHVAAARDALRRPSTAAPPASEPGTPERAIEELDPRERLALVLHHHAGLSTHDLARALRCSAEHAHATLREAHRRLGVERDDEDIPEVELDEP